MIFRRKTKENAGAAAGKTAATVRMLAVLLESGATPADAWRHLADAGDMQAAAIVRTLGARGRGRHDDIVTALQQHGAQWQEVAAAWEVAATVGAPLADLLRGFAESLSDTAAAADDVRVTLSEPLATARFMLWLPAAGLLLGAALGFDTAGVLLGTLPGLVCLVGGVLLVVGGHLWTRALVRRARPGSEVPGLRAELLAVALSGGASIERGLSLVRDVTGATSVATAEGQTRRVLDLSQSAGVPAVSLLRASATHERHMARVEARMRAAALATRLLLPLGVCTLPAFLLLGVAPMFLAVLFSTPMLSFGTGS